MFQALKIFMKSHRQTKFFILILAIYLIAIIWTTIQSYARVEYSRSDLSDPVIIHIPETTDHS